MKSKIRLLIVDEGISLGGVKTLWTSLIPELENLCECVIWMMPAHRVKPCSKALPTNSNVVFETFHWPNFSFKRAYSALIRRIFYVFELLIPTYKANLEQALFEERLNRIVDYYEVTHIHYAALFAQRYPKVSVPVTASVMDINYDPLLYNSCIKNLYCWMSKQITIVTISNFTKDEVGKVCRLSPANIISIPIASSAVNHWKEDRNPIHLPCLYYPASFNPHKGHSLLFRALEHLEETGLDFRLVLTGSDTDLIKSKKPLEIPELEEARQIYSAASVSFCQKIDIRGRVSSQEVEDCFTAATLVVLPSRYEGFGLPLSEAVARGRRVVCSDIPAFREQVDLYGFKKAVKFVSGTKSMDWSSAIKLALAQPARSPYSYDDICKAFARRTWKDVANDYVRALNP